MEEGKCIYHNGMVTVKVLTEEEKAEYRKLKPGVYQNVDRIRGVAVENGEMQIVETTIDEVSRIWFPL